MQKQSLDTRKERMAVVKESNAQRAAAFIGSQANARKQASSTTSCVSSEATSLGRDMDAIRAGRAKRFAEMHERAAQQSAKK